MSSNSDASIPAELYSLVLQFLKDAGLSQTANIFKKEINKSIKVVNQKFGLIEVYKSYNSLVAGKNIEKVESDDSSSISENSSNNEENENIDESSSSSEDDDQSSEDEVLIKGINSKNESDKVDESSDEELKNDNEMEDSLSFSSEDDNDSSDSSDSSSIEEENNDNALGFGKESDSSDSSSSDSSSEQSENEEQSVEASNVNEDSDLSNESSSESSSSNSLSEDDEENSKMKVRSDNELVSSSSEESDKEQEKGSNVTDTRDNNKTNSSNNSNDNESEESNSESEDESKPGNTQNNINNIKEHSGENRDKLFHSNGKIASTEIGKSESSNSPHKINVPLTNGNKLKHKLDSNNDTLAGKDYTRPSKKLNSNVSTKYVTTSVHFKPLSVYKNQRKNGKSNKTENKSNGNGNIYNRRINPEEVEFLDERLKDNSFLAKDGAIDSYGYKAHNDLFATRGKDFRAQKTKKKRGSYRGGKIDFESHSIKFAVDD